MMNLVLGSTVQGATLHTCIPRNRKNSHQPKHFKHKKGGIAGGCVGKMGTRRCTNSDGEDVECPSDDDSSDSSYRSSVAQRSQSVKERKQPLHVVSRRRILLQKTPGPVLRQETSQVVVQVPKLKVRMDVARARRITISLLWLRLTMWMIPEFSMFQEGTRLRFPSRTSWCWIRLRRLPGIRLGEMQVCKG